MVVHKLKKKHILILLAKKLQLLTGGMCAPVTE